MRSVSLLAGVCAASLLGAARSSPFSQLSHVEKRKAPLAPKVFLIDMFAPEGDVWYGIPEFDLLAQNISIPGLSPLYPEAHCTANGEVCQIVTGESEINAATSVTALAFSGYFNLTKTYFMVAGIAGINPEVATLGSVAFARYAVQVALQYEFDAREIPSNWTNGYVPFNAFSPTGYPQTIYGTEVFEVNERLRDLAILMARSAKLNDSAIAKSYRARYKPAKLYAAAAEGPSVVACDVATSDVYYSGTLLSEAFENTTRIWTNGTGLYCTTAQEDNATLEALLRAAVHNLTDFSRIIVMRTASDFDRPPPGISQIDNLLYVDQGGFEPAIQNIYLAGIKVVMGILDGWNSTFATGVKPKNYIGDILDTFGSKYGKPDYGLPSAFIGGASKAKRSVEIVNKRVQMRGMGDVRM